MVEQQQGDQPEAAKQQTAPLQTAQPAPPQAAAEQAPVSQTEAAPPQTVQPATVAVAPVTQTQKPANSDAPVEQSPAKTPSLTNVVEDHAQNNISLPRIAVLPFTGMSGNNGENIALLLSNDREIQTAFTVVPRTSSINSLVSGQRFQTSGLTDSDTISAIGKELDADFVITGHIRKLGERNLVIINIVQVDNFRQVSGAYREFSEIGELRNLLPDITKRMVEATRIDASKMPGLAILPFSVPPDVSAQDAEVLAQLLAVELANTGRYMLLPRTTAITSALTETQPEQLAQFSVKAGLADINSVRAIGKVVNAQYVLAGNVIRLGENVNLFLAQILNIETAALLVGSDVEYRTITDGLHLMPELSFQLTGIRSEREDDSVPANMVRVAGGSFRMGSTIGEADESPVYTVYINSFFMGKTEVTQGEYRAIIGTNPSGVFGDTLPVENVSWYDAVEYCNKLSLKEGLTPAYSGSIDNITCNFTANGYRLPTEAEWEYAARGGNRDSLAFSYAGGNSVGVLGWYINNSEKHIRQVGTKSPNSLGLYDMSGNVWEWCWDWYGAYPSVEQSDPKGAQRGSYRVTRGGSWNSSADQLRTTYRSYGDPSAHYHDLGFRVIRPIF
ncbi:MAG: SUMF1/EgtB/PvdO family nonheme iron enzyme [Treponema sp.]|nr:SUMF1/EgtB/PvdO family nonheme iron enzyme [Treponema sp.]